MTNILILILLLFLALPGYGQNLTPDTPEPQIVPIIQNSFAGGQNNRDNIDSIDEKEAALIRNAIIEDIGVIKKRKGDVVVGDSLGSTTILGLGVYTHSDSTVRSRLLVAAGTVIKELNSAETAFTNVATGLTTGKDTNFVIADDYAFIANGTDQIRYYDSKAGTVTAFTGGSLDPPISKIGYFIKERVFWVPENNPSHIRYSAASKVLSYPAANDVPINEDDGQRILGMQAFRNDLLIFKERSIWALDMTGADPLANWKVSAVDSNYGTLAWRTIKQLGGDVIFLDQFGRVRSLLRTQLDALQPGARPFSDTIRTSLQNLNRANISKCSAEVWEDDYILSYPSGTSQTTNNAILVWNSRQKSWTEYTGWNGAMFTKFTLSNVDYLIMGDAATGTVYRCYSGTSDNGTAIDFDVQTREYTADYLDDKIWILLDVLCEATGGGDLTISVQQDSAGWASLATLGMGGNAPTLPQTLPFNLGSEALARGKYHLNTLGRSRGIQFRFRNNTATDSVTLRQIAVFGRILPFKKE